MGTLILYALGILIRIGQIILSAPLALINSFVTLPGLATIWGMWVWLCSLFGTPGATLLGFSQGLMLFAVLYLPFYVIRKIQWRPEHVDTHIIHRD